MIGVILTGHVIFRRKDLKPGTKLLIGTDITVEEAEKLIALGDTYVKAISDELKKDEPTAPLEETEETSAEPIARTKNKKTAGYTIFTAEVNNDELAAE